MILNYRALLTQVYTNSVTLTNNKMIDVLTFKTVNRIRLFEFIANSRHLKKESCVAVRINHYQPSGSYSNQAVR